MLPRGDVPSPFTHNNAGMSTNSLNHITYRVCHIRATSTTLSSFGVPILPLIDDRNFETVTGWLTEGIILTVETVEVRFRRSSTDGR